MKIVGVSLGSRNGMNDTVCKEALDAAREEGAEVSFIHLLDWDIKTCTGCVACSKGLVTGKGNICTRKDEYDDFRSQLLDADGILFVDPIFEKGASGLYHDLMDRSGPRIDRGMNLRAEQLANEGTGKPIDKRLLKDRVISYIAIGGSDWATACEYEHAILSLSTNWKTIDNEKFAWSKTIIMDDKKMERCREIGKNLAKAAADIEHAKYLGDPGVCPHCHNKNFYIEPDSTNVTCCLCGMEGKFEIVNDAIKFVFTDEMLLHAHDTPTGKEKHVNDVLRNETEAQDIMKKSDKYKFYQEKIKTYDIEEILPPAKR